MTESDPSGNEEWGSDFRRQSGRPDEFAVMLAHDLRNPLAVAMGRLAEAREEVEVDSEPLDAVARAHERMEAIIEDYLTLAREGTMVIERGPVELAEVAENCWRNVVTSEATLVIDTERTIYADYDRVQRLLENLIRNAVEHGGDDVTITIGELDDGFYVADDGPGIPPTEREMVLGGGYTSVDKGTGIGLSIVKKIVEAHGWTLAETSSGGGTRFEIANVGSVS